MKNKSELKNSSRKRVNPLLVIVFVVLVIYVLTLIFTLGWGLLTSLKSTEEFLYRVQYYVNEAGEIIKIEDANGDWIRNPNVLGLPDVIYSANYFNFLIELDGVGLGQYNIFKNYEFIMTSFNKSIRTSGYYSTIWGAIQGKETNGTIPIYVLNSIIYAAGGSLLFSFTSMISGYLCAKYKFKFSKFLYAFLLIMMAVPLVGTSVSTTNLLKNLGIFDTYFAMLIMNATFGGMYFFVYYAFFQGMSTAFIEAAEIDGASQTRVLFEIIFPLSAKMFGTIFLIQFINLWNAYEPIMLYYPSQPTLSYAIYLMNKNTEGGNIDTQSTPQRIAGCMVLAMPVLILFCCFNKIIMGNLSIGGVKE